MYILIKNHKYLYNVQTTVQIFFQNEKFISVLDIEDNGYTVSSIKINNTIETSLYLDKKLILKFNNNIDTDISHCVKVSVFLLLKEYFNYYPVYGILTGIRPTKLVQKLFALGNNDNEVRKILKEKYLVQDEKIEFLINVSKNELEVVKNINTKNNALYIGIPFCPSICSYCSFTSFNMKKYIDNGVMGKYVELLIEEVRYVIKNSKNKIENIYIGGGTPTSLLDEYFEELLKSISELINIKEIKEFTVEAGRVDTITYNKLKIMKKYNVSRISINAQTTNNEILKQNNRSHTKEDFFNVFNLAREVGFSYINVDIIVGLLGEEKESIIKTLDEILNLKPENITIHTLAIKKGSTYKQSLSKFEFLESYKIKTILEDLYRMLYKNDYIPYYMYRQKNILGNFENAGFSIRGYQSIYNVAIILEIQSIIGTGAGSASKYINDKDIKRIYNLKGVEEYIENFNSIIKRKEIFV